MPGTRRLRRGIYLLPTLFTVGNLFCGFFSLIQASRGQFEPAAVLILLAALLDWLDGRVARLTGTTSEFGLEFDSLADLVSFGLAPAFLVYQWALLPLRRLGWLVAFLFVVCAAMRLARFNIQHGPANRRYFAGLPAPPAATALACAAFAYPLPPGGMAPALTAVLVVVVAGLMVSRIRYRSFKDVDLRNRRSYLYVLPVAAAIVAIAWAPAAACATFVGAYVASGPVAYVVGAARSRRRGARREEAARSHEVINEPLIR